MIRGFWKSKLACGAIVLLSVLLAAVTGVRDMERGYPAYIPLAAAALTLGIGAAAGKLAGNIVANSCNTKLLGILHVDLDPTAFLLAYEPVVKRLKPGSWDWAVARACLADGCAAAGEFTRAIETISPDCAGKPQAVQAVKALYYSSLCSYAVSAGDCEKAREAAAALEEVISAPETKPAFAQNMRLQLTLCRERLSCLEGGSVDRQWLTGQLDRAAYAMRRLEIMETLARCALQRGREAEARAYLERLCREAGKTRYRAWAEGELRQLEERQ